jgi:hypothetical protein
MYVHVKRVVKYRGRYIDVSLQPRPSTLQVLNFIASVNLEVFQRVVSDDILSLEFVHAASRLFG